MYKLIKKKYLNKSGGSSQSSNDSIHNKNPLLFNYNIPLKWGDYFLQIQDPEFNLGYYIIDNNLNYDKINDKIKEQEYNNNIKLDLLNYINIELCFRGEKLIDKYIEKNIQFNYLFVNKFDTIAGIKSYLKIFEKNEQKTKLLDEFFNDIFSFNRETNQYHDIYC